jgi:colanic acid biosynthesis glycosyl transferase WcaI
MESIIYSKAARVFAISRKMGEKIKSKIREDGKVFTFRNWVNVEAFQPQIKYNGFRSKNNLDNKFVVLYSGNIGYKQGLNVILEAAEKTVEHRDFTYVVAGDGAYKRKLMTEYNKSSQSNVRFLPLQPVEHFPSALAACDVCIIPQRKTAIDIALPSKLLAIMSSARPVIVGAQRGSELHRIVTESDCGVVVEPENPKQTVEAILRIYQNPEEMHEMGLNGRAYAIEHFSREKILQGFERELLNINN